MDEHHAGFPTLEIADKKALARTSYILRTSDGGSAYDHLSREQLLELLTAQAKPSLAEDEGTPPPSLEGNHRGQHDQQADSEQGCAELG